MVVVKKCGLPAAAAQPCLIVSSPQQHKPPVDRDATHCSCHCDVMVESCDARRGSHSAVPRRLPALPHLPHLLLVVVATLLLVSNVTLWYRTLSLQHELNLLKQLLPGGAGSAGGSDATAANLQHGDVWAGEEEEEVNWEEAASEESVSYLYYACSLWVATLVPCHAFN